MHELIRHLRQHRFALTAAGIALMGTLLTWLIWPGSLRFPFALFIAAVMVSAWRGGLRPGLVTTGASTLALLILFLLFPAFRDAEQGEHFLLRLGMFVLIGVLAGYLAMKCREAVVAHDRFHDTVASLGEALVFTDVQGKVTFLNATAQALTGCAPTDVEGKPLGQAIALLDGQTRLPLDDPAERTLRDNVASALPDGALLVSAGKLETPIDGKAIPLHDADNRLVGVAIAFHAAAARRQAEQELRQREQRYRVALGGAPTALLLLDVRGHCLFSNRACQTLGGFTFDEGLGQGWTRCIHLDDRDQLLGGWTAALEKEAGAFAGEFRSNGGRDEARWLRLRSTPIFSDKGQTLGHVATIEDLTELKKAESARRASEEHAAAAAQRQKKIEEALAQLGEDVQRQLQAGEEEKRQSEEKLRALENAKKEAERARDEHLAARRQAEETLHGSQLEFARLMDEHLAAKRQAEQSLQLARDESTEQLAAQAAARQEAEEALLRLLEESAPPTEDHAAARHQAEEALHAARQEIDKLTADFLNDMSGHEEKLADARHGEEEARKESDNLRQEVASLGARLDERERELALARQSLDELAREKERLEERVRSTPPPAPPPAAETPDRNGHPEPAASTATPSPAGEGREWIAYN
jgi:PAS domain S-box-containing protein